MLAQAKVRCLSMAIKLFSGILYTRYPSSGPGQECILAERGVRSVVDQNGPSITFPRVAPGSLVSLIPINLLRVLQVQWPPSRMVTVLIL